MAPKFLFLPLLLLSLLPLSSVAQNNGSVPVGASLATGDRPWLSPSGDFAFGFRRIDSSSSSNNNSGAFLLAIWYNKIPDRTIVWHASSTGVDNLAPQGSKLELSPDNGLVLTSPQGGRLWNSQLSSGGSISYGFMNDTGNFVIGSRNSGPLWESFSEPTDTLLPSQTMPIGGEVNSRRTETNFSRGRFQLRLIPDGNLVLNTVNMDTRWTYDAYYWSNTYDGNNVSNSGYQLIFDRSGSMYVVRRNGRISNLTQVVSPGSDYYHRATLNFDGVFIQYFHPKDSTRGDGWQPLWSQPDNICVNLVTEKGSGACGFNSICKMKEDRRPTCACPRGFRLFDENDTYGECKPNFVQDCEGEGSRDAYEFLELPNTDWPTSDYEQLKPYNGEDCKENCLRDCMCAVAIINDGSCWKKKLPLSNGRQDGSFKGTALIKIRKDGSPPLPPNPRNIVPGERRKDKKGTLVVVGSVLLGTSLFVNLVLLVAGCFVFSFIHQKKVIVKTSNAETRNAADTNLRCFAYGELVDATDGFKEELGRGSFGIVYKGVVKLGAASAVSPVAVKKLDRVVQDSEKEFRTEVNVIGKTHHKNLVRLLGFCDQGPHRLLVYEYLSNGALASFLFGEKRPSWDQRTQIAIGIASGLLYLHEECSRPIIHCDIKPQNILLDEHHTARISDFGLAKLLMLDQSQTHTAIRGTKGYVAPDWFRKTPITPKIDVYSFGVLLLEIVCCRRSLDMEFGEEQNAFLTDWAYDCYRERKLDMLVGDDMEAKNDCRKLERFVKTGLWCIQEDPSLRPTVRKVTQMLEGVVDVAVPSCPFPYSSCATEC